MIEIKFKSMIALIIITVFLFVSANTFATSVMGDDRHEQNKVIDQDERDAEKLNKQSGSSSQNRGQQEQSGQGQSGQMSSGERQNQSSGSGSEKKSGH